MTPDAKTLLAQAEFVRRVARSLVRDTAAAEDVVQETLLRALRHPLQATHRWLFTVARNLGRTQARGDRRRRRYERATARSDRVASAAELVSRAELHRLVVCAILELDEPYRHVVLLRYFEDLPPREIAERTGTPVETVRVRLRRALAQLRGHLDYLHGGDRRTWSLALLPLAAPRNVTAGTLLTGATIMGKKAILIAAVAATAGSTLTLVATGFGERNGHAASRADGGQRRDIAAARRELERTQQELRQAEAALARSRSKTTRPAVSPGVDPEAQRARVAQLRAEMNGWFERGEAAEALAALRELLAMKTEGWPLAMELWLKIRDDSGRRSSLGLSDMAAATALGDAAVIQVMVWALENPAPADFREHAAWDLPWRRELARTLEQYSRLLPREKDSQVQWALIEGLAGMQTGQSQAALLKMLDDFTVPSNVRGMVATRLVELAQWITHGKPTTGPGAALVQGVRKTAASDPGVEARAAATAAMIAFDPDATGFLVTGFQSADALGKQAGLEVGDIVVTYDRRPVPNGSELNKLSRPWRDGPKDIDMLVVRAGEKLTLHTRRDFLGVYGLAVAR